MGQQAICKFLVIDWDMHEVKMCGMIKAGFTLFEEPNLMTDQV